MNNIVADYVFMGQTGDPIRLSELFGERETLVMIHNMGSHCPYCTEWADDLNRIVPALSERMAFVVESPDAPRIQAQQSRARAWTFRMVSSQGTFFKADMGFVDADNRPFGGVSVFKRQAERLIRVQRDAPTPSDDSSSEDYFIGLLAGEGPEPLSAVR
jgi:predicted dithiol-disulfide oxidoreductase (DUF899 family)